MVCALLALAEKEIGRTVKYLLTLEARGLRLDLWGKAT
jgi:hypothetical protein